MALNFPNSPTNGQLYTDTMSGNSWTWDSANTCWKSTSTYIQTITVASSAPGTPAVGQLWWNQDYGRLLVYYSDGTSSQWVDASPSDYTSGLAYNQANAVSIVANNAFANTSGTFNGNLTVSGNVVANKQVTVTYTPATTVNAAITLAGANTQGGTGYADFLKASNLSGGTNPHKTFRLNSTGGIEVVNSAYTALIMSLGDDGSFGVGSRGISKASMPSGSILQVVNAIKTGTTSINAGSMTDVPGMSATITPTSSTSNILILISVAYSGYASSPALQILRNSTVLSWGDAGGGAQSRAWHGTHWSSGTTNLQYVSMRNTLIHLDSPATTSSTTYKLQATSYYNNAVTINAAYADLIGGDTSSYMVRTVSTITLMEVAG